MFLAEQRRYDRCSVCQACLGLERESRPLLAVGQTQALCHRALNDGYQLRQAHWLLDVNTATRRHIGKLDGV
jgi:hypothetical protein